MQRKLFHSVLDTDGSTPLQNNVRRLAQHNMTFLTNTHQANLLDGMPNVRSFTAQGCFVERQFQLPSFKLLRVLAIENCRFKGYRLICVEPLGDLLHLRYLCIRTDLQKIPEETGALRFLQTLDLCAYVHETSWTSTLPAQLLCFSFKLLGVHKIPCLERLTSLEELSGDQLHAKELGSLRELRVLDAW